MASASSSSPGTLSLLRPQVSLLLLLLLSLLLCSPARAFWFSPSRAKSQGPQWFGIRDYGAASQAAYSYDTAGGMTVAVPVAVPLSPQSVQVSPPYPGLGTVQLVPCLCPISKDPESVKPLPPGAAGSAPPVPMGALPPMGPPMPHMGTMPATVVHQQGVQQGQ